MQRNFYSRFGLEISLDEGKRKFINRVKDTLFIPLKNSSYDYSNYRFEDILQHICTELGEQISDYEIDSYGGIYYHGLDKVIKNDFEKTLYVLELLSPIITRKKYDVIIKNILKLSTDNDGIDLGIRYHNGLFYLSGDKDLDEQIIEKSLDNISGFKAKADYEKALGKFLTGDLHSTLVSCFTTLETLSQEILQNEKQLLANKVEILKFFGGSESFSKQWNGILNGLYDYFNDFSERHNGDERDNIDVLEVEATLYQTGLIINLLIHKYNSLGKQ